MLPSGYALVSHSHSIAQITGLQTALNGKLNLTGGTLTGNLTANASILMPFRGTAGTDRLYQELQGVSANDGTNENSGAFIRFRTSTADGYGADIGAYRRGGGNSALIIKTGGQNPTESVRIDENKNMIVQGTISASGQSVVLNNDSRLSTNLGYTASTRVLTSSTGSNVTLPEVVANGNSGLMIGADKNKLNGIQAGAQVNVGTNLGSSGTGATRTITSSTGNNTSITYSATDIGAAPISHTHIISDVTNLTAQLDSKAPISHTHAIGDVTNLTAQLDSKAPTSHAVNADTYGYATTTNAGHVRVGTGLSVTNGTVSNASPNANHSGDVTGDTALTIANGAVSLAKMASLTADRIIGRITSNGTPQALTATNVRTIITDSSNRFLTDTERTNWNTAYNHVGNSALHQNTITRLRGTTSGSYVSGDITLNTLGAISINQSGNTITTSISNVTQSDDGAMSASDKVKLDSLGSYIPSEVHSTTLVNSQTFTTDHLNKFIRVGTTGPRTFTVNNMGAIGDEIHLMQNSTADVTIQGNMVIILSDNGKNKIAGRYQMVTLKKVSNGYWVLMGALK